MDGSPVAKLGASATCAINLGGYDAPGTISFVKDDINVKESSKKVLIEIHRKGGAAGGVTCIMNTKCNTATKGYDYVEVENKVITFDQGATKQVCPLH